MKSTADLGKAALGKAAVTFKSQDDAELHKDIDVQVRRSREVTIATPDDYEQAAELLKGYATLAKRVEEYFAEDIATAHKLHKSLTTKRKAALEKVEAEVARIKRAMAEWRQRQDEERRRQEAELAAKLKAEEDARILREAAALEAAGDTQTAAAIVEEQLAAPAPVVRLEPAAPKVAGVSMVEAWDFEVVNAALLPREYLVPDLAKIRGVVKALKGGARIPGVRVFRADQVRVRA